MYPYFTLLGQSLGSIWLGLEALNSFVPGKNVLFHIIFHIISNNYIIYCKSHVKYYFRYLH